MDEGAPDGFASVPLLVAKRVNKDLKNELTLA
jgi:hypothetical protein